MRISDWSSDVCSSDLPRVLRQVGDAGARLQEALAPVEILQPGDHLQQGRLAGAVAADQAGALAARQGQRQAAEQRRGAEGEAGILQGDEGRSHAYLMPRSFLISS